MNPRRTICVRCPLISSSAVVLIICALLPSSAAAQVPDSAGAIGKEVRVIRVDRSRDSGQLVSLSDIDVVLRRGSVEQRWPLDQVQRVERVRHHVRNVAWWGTAVGGAIGFLIGAANTSDTSEIIAGTAVCAGIGAAGGAGIGALINAVGADGNLVYQQRGPSSSRGASAILATRRQGIALALRW